MHKKRLILQEGVEVGQKAFATNDLLQYQVLPCARRLTYGSLEIVQIILKPRNISGNSSSIEPPQMMRCLYPMLIQFQCPSVMLDSGLQPYEGKQIGRQKILIFVVKPTR